VDPSKWDPRIIFVYAFKSSTTSLRYHIINQHASHYMALAKEKGWKNMLAGFRSQARLQAAYEAVTSQPEQLDNFDESTFHQYLLSFIVADDQVCSHFIFLCLHAHVHVPILKVPKSCRMSRI